MYHFQNSHSCVQVPPHWFSEVFHLPYSSIMHLQHQAQQTFQKLPSKIPVLSAQIKKHFSHSFAFDVPTFWNALSEEV